MEARAPRRARQAAMTRDDILASARRLFAEQGFVATTLADIARDAEVAVQTIYSSVGSKVDVVMALFQQVSPDAGRESADVVAALAAATDAAGVFGAGLSFMRRLQEASHDVIAAVHAAAAQDPEAAEVLAEGRRRHRYGTRAMAERLATIGCLREGVTTDEAADVISMMTSFETFAQLTGTYGWSYARCERWLTDSLERLLTTR